ncbi:methylated-DNA-[protein]-cysteine S-methyltransferase, partial [mine drainage metagenome]
TVRVVDLLEHGVAQTGVPAGAVRRRPPFDAASPPHQFADYFRGRRAAFDVEIDPVSPSAFDRGVWAELRKVRAGEIVTYAELARRSGHPGSARAVGGAMARNPIPIIVPCHRVVGCGGSITGYGMGLWRKRWLLDHEGAWPIRSRSADGPRGRAQRTLDQALGPGRRPRPPVDPPKLRIP